MNHMNHGRLVVVGVTVCIVAVTLATGPVGLVALDPPEEIGQDSIGNGNATVEVLSAPDTISIQKSNDGQGLHHIRVPNTRVSISNLSGNPALTYSVSVDALGVGSNSVHPLESAGEGETTLSIDRITTRNEVENVTTASLRIIIYADTRRTLFTKEVTVEGPE
jgi:hypothetical protein